MLGRIVFVLSHRTNNCTLCSGHYGRIWKRNMAFGNIRFGSYSFYNSDRPSMVQRERERTNERFFFLLRERDNKRYTTTRFKKKVTTNTSKSNNTITKTQVCVFSLRCVGDIVTIHCLLQRRSTQSGFHSLWVSVPCVSPGFTACESVSLVSVWASQPVGQCPLCQSGFHSMWVNIPCVSPGFTAYMSVPPVSTLASQPVGQCPLFSATFNLLLSSYRRKVASVAISATVLICIAVTSGP